MNFCIGIIYHPDEFKYIRILANYYYQFAPLLQYPVNFMNESEAVARNNIQKMAKDYEYIVTLDSDEILEKSNILALVDLMEKKRLDIGMCRMLDYMAPNSVVTPQRGFEPITIIRTGQAKYYDKRCAHADRIEQLGFNIHHLYFLDREKKRERYIQQGNNEVKVCEAMSKYDIIKQEPPKEIQDVIQLMAGV